MTKRQQRKQQRYINMLERTWKPMTHIVWEVSLEYILKGEK